jgi:transposase
MRSQPPGGCDKLRLMGALEVQKELAMKERNTEPKRATKRANRKRTPNTELIRVRKNIPDLSIGIDLGDRNSRYCVLDAEATILFERETRTNMKAMERTFGALDRCRIAIEVGTHSPWVSRVLKKLGHEVYVANARQLELITKSSRKDDRMDARTLARLVRIDPEMLRPIQHRSEDAQADLTMVRLRADLMEARTKLINAVRGVTKGFGERLSQCDADYVGPQRMAEDLKELPEMARWSVTGVLEQVVLLTKQIQAMDARVAQVAREKYPVTARLKQVSGVGDLTALTFVLTLEDSQRFERSRDVGCYLGMRPKRRDSGSQNPQLRISKEGDRYLRKLLVQSAHYILGRNGPDTDLRRWGMKLAGENNKNAKRRAVVAVARKLAVLLHRLWVSGEKYEPLRNSEPKKAA